MLSTNSYERMVRDFRWTLPRSFNFGRDVVDAQAAADDRLALLCTSDTAPATRYRFSDIARLSSRYAHALRRAGVQAGDRVLVQLPRIAEWHIVLTACTKLGAVPVPCIEMLTDHDVRYRAEHCTAMAVVTTPLHVRKYAGCRGIRVRACIGVAPGWIDLPAEAARESDDIVCADMPIESPAVMYYTSGSSGLPKGVTHAARALYAWRHSAVYWQALGPGELMWCTADTGWSKSGTGSLFAPWGAGSAVMFHNGGFDATRRLELLAEHRVTVFCAAATEFRQLVQLEVASHDLSSLRLCVSAGESVNPELVVRWKHLSGVDLLDGYGQTETLMVILNYPCMPLKPGSMGKPIPGTEFEIIDDAGDALPPNRVGHIAMSLPNPQFMLGYWNEHDRTQAGIASTPRGERWLTGDMGYRDIEGYFFYAGRADDIISSAGYRIGPMEVENALMQHPDVVEVAVIGKRDSERGEIVKAFVVLRRGVEANSELKVELQEFVKRTTAPYKYPREIEFRGELPKSAAGKLLRRVLRDAEARIDSSSPR